MTLQRSLMIPLFRSQVLFANVGLAAVSVDFGRPCGCLTLNAGWAPLLLLPWMPHLPTCSNARLRNHSPRRAGLNA